MAQRLDTLNPSTYLLVSINETTNSGFVIARGSAAAIVGNTLKTPIKAGSSFIYFIDMILLPVSPQDVYSKFLSSNQQGGQQGGANAQQQQGGANAQFAPPPGMQAQPKSGKP